MTGSALLEYARDILSHVPWEHWAEMGVVSLALTAILLIRKKCSVYGAIALGLFLLDAAVVIRYLGITPHTSGHNLTLDFARLLRESGQRSAESISNIAIFVPFGFFLAESLASLNQTGPGAGSWRRIVWVVLAAFGLSLCIECLQLILKVGYFELTDLVMNTVGGGVGGCLSVGGGRWWGRRHVL